MKKYYLKNGKEVHIGDVIRRSSKSKLPYGETVLSTSIIKITKDTLPRLIQGNVITVKEVDGDKVNIPIELEYYIKKISARLGWKLDKVYNYLNTLSTIYPSAVLSIILREVAIELDKKYKDHIEASPEIYVISLLNGKITKVNKAYIKNYRNFAAFRSIKDAKVACSIVKSLLEDLFTTKNAK